MTLPPRHASSLGYIQTSVVNKQQYNNTQTGAHERRSQNPMVCRKTLEHISWRVRHFFLESPAFLPGESGIFSWRVRHFFLESPVSFPGESGIFSWRVLASQGSTRGRIAALGLTLLSSAANFQERIIRRTSPLRSSKKFTPRSETSP